ncbi:superoxide dismutase [Nocardia otitidiscaviarum]|uniref:SMP-30/gluconolactonase/LRE family protein n=1 Tax=Nocardia otitidiscaviarum TaxID=1823 RepID=UPI0018944985|nr:superoxide dismutase [Nocardia otitidiscaviarum]MBF6237419.1 superoxide dismutase [Nocardia otitidiscaviarum]
MLTAPRRMPTFTATLAAALVLTACGQSDEPAASSNDPGTRVVTAYTLPDDRAYPEGIALDARTGDTYVGSYTNGAVYRAAAGATAAEVFLPAGTDGRATANGMKVDDHGRLWVTDSTAGVAVYDIATRARVARFDVPGDAPRFVNDLDFAPDGTAYLTDSIRSVVYRVTPEQVAAGGNAELAPVFDLAPHLEPLPEDAFGINGIVVDPTGRYLLIVDMTGGDLYRIATAPDAVEPVRKVVLNGGDVAHGDGLDLVDHTLRVAHNTTNTLSRWTMSDDYATATVTERFTDESLAIPTTLVRVGDRTLVVASQFDKGGPMAPGTPTTPFRIVAVRI